MEPDFVVIAHDIRSSHNVGSIFRTSDGAGVSKIFLTGYTMCPAVQDAPYLTRAERDLAKTALGAERSVVWERMSDLGELVERLKREGYEIVALEQSERSIPYDAYQPQGEKVALLLGAEVDGLSQEALDLSDTVVDIPMRGMKESLNVSVAFGIAAYHIAGTIKKDTTRV